MLLPQAFIDGARGFAMGDYLTFLAEGERLLAAHPRAGALERPGALLVGWAELIDQVIEADARAVAEDRRALFVRATARKAISDVSAALAELKPEQLDASQLEGITPAETLLQATAFVAQAEKLSASLDAVRAPAWRKLWWGESGRMPVIDPAHLPFPVVADSAADGAVLTTDQNHGRQRLELRTAGKATHALEVDPAARTGVLTAFTRFDVASNPGAISPDGTRPSEEDLEIGLYDWAAEQIESLGKRQAGPELPEFICSFCGKAQKEVKKLIAGPSLFICNECVQLCVDILAEESAG